MGKREVRANERREGRGTKGKVGKIRGKSRGIMEGNYVKISVN